MDGSELLQIFDFSAGPRFNTWSWGLAPRPDRPAGKDFLLYYMSVVTVHAVVAPLPVVVLYAVAFGTQLLAPLIMLLLFLLVIPLYARFGSGRWHPPVEELDAL